MEFQNQYPDNESVFTDKSKETQESPGFMSKFSSLLEKTRFGWLAPSVAIMAMTWQGCRSNNQAETSPVITPVSESVKSEAEIQGEHFLNELKPLHEAAVGTMLLATKEDNFGYEIPNDPDGQPLQITPEMTNDQIADLSLKNNGWCKKLDNIDIDQYREVQLKEIQANIVEVLKNKPELAKKILDQLESYEKTIFTDSSPVITIEGPDGQLKKVQVLDATFADDQESFIHFGIGQELAGELYELPTEEESKVIDELLKADSRFIQCAISESLGQK